MNSKLDIPRNSFLMKIFNYIGIYTPLQYKYGLLSQPVWNISKVFIKKNSLKYQDHADLDFFL